MSAPAAPQGSEHALNDHPDVKALGARFDQIAPTAMTNAVHGLAFLGGAYAAISPWVVGFHGQSSLTVNNLIIGLAVVLLAFGYATAYERTRNLAWVSALMGVWLIITPWAVHGVDRTTHILVSNIIVGAAIALLGAAATGMDAWRHRRSRAARH